MSSRKKRKTTFEINQKTGVNLIRDFINNLSRALYKTIDHMTDNNLFSTHIRTVIKMFQKEIRRKFVKGRKMHLKK